MLEGLDGEYADPNTHPGNGGGFHRGCLGGVPLLGARSPKAAEVVYIEGEEPVLHYLVGNRSTGGYLEVTLGWRAARLEYYFIRPVHPDDYEHIHAEFKRSIQDWTEEHVGWIGRKVLRIHRIV